MPPARQEVPRYKRASPAQAPGIGADAGGVVRGQSLPPHSVRSKAGLPGLWGPSALTAFEGYIKPRAF